MAAEPHRPRMSAERAAALRRWHDRAYDELHSLGNHDVEYLGLRLTVPEHVFPPAPMSQLLGRAVQAEVRATDRVLDMGTGCGVNAILAGAVAAQVVAVDLNPHAVDAAAANVARHGLGDRVQCRRSDLFDGLAPGPDQLGLFDLIVFDPPFRWFTPRDLLEVAFADEDYRTLTRFFAEVGPHLAPGGRVLIFFGTSGDMDYLDELIAGAGFTARTVESTDFTRDGLDVTYSALRLTR